MDSFFSELEQIFHAHLRVAARGGKRISYETIGMRRKGITAMFRCLRSGQLVARVDGQLVRQPRYELVSPWHLKRKHVTAIIDDLVERGVSVAYLHNQISILRVFTRWIGKPDLVGRTEDIISDPSKKRRVQYATRDKSWSGNGVDVAMKLEQIRQYDPRIALALELAWAFGMRIKEALLLRPILADQGSYLDINRGAKNGRDRTHPITTDGQRELLARAKALVGDRYACLIPRGQSFVQGQNRLYYVLKKFGITRRAVNVSSHGLRHESLNDLYESITGMKSPAQGGIPGAVDPELDRAARTEVAERAGHARRTVSSAYLGPMHRGGKRDDPQPTAMPANPEAADGDSESCDEAKPSHLFAPAEL